MEIKGQIIHIGETEQISDTFQKRLVVVKTEEQYPQEIPTEFTQDRCVVLDNYKVGQHVTVAVNLRGRGWVSADGVKKWFPSIQGWKIEAQNETVGNTTPPPAADEGEDDSPF